MLEINNATDLKGLDENLICIIKWLEVIVNSKVEGSEIWNQYQSILDFYLDEPTVVFISNYQIAIFNYTTN